MTEENKPVPKILTVLVFAFFGLMMYAMLGRSYVGVQEGYWGVLSRISTSLIMLVLLPAVAYFSLTQLKKGNETLWEDFKDLLAVLACPVVFLMLFADLTDGIYYPLFENHQTVVSDSYRFYYELYRGEKIYYLVFDDKNNPDSCNSKYQKCRYTYKLRINGKTYDDLQHLNSSNKDNPLQLTFKPKARILMKLEVAKQL
ncbi:Uncharacterised protein [Moraxella caprae]|uniref:Uncharacterized protein n=1 Tax=Moraxella caprae TaxID=90240 RepID=A0A378QYX2_9GAMM|nr:hypothetical protein [Moraxella caprae]STZ08125.1 Uncharacterised protein [Moraxella caprae]